MPPSFEDEAQAALTWLKRHSTTRTFEGIGAVRPTLGQRVWRVGDRHSVLAKKLGRNHELAAALWKTSYYETHAGMFC